MAGLPEDWLRVAEAPELIQAMADLLLRSSGLEPAADGAPD